jgi:hypothetical protein
VSSLGYLPRTLWLICGIGTGCSLYPETPPIVDSGLSAGATGGSSGGSSGGLAGTSGSAQGGTSGAACAEPVDAELVAAADAFVASNQPSTMHGVADFLELDPNGVRRVILRFTLPSPLSTTSVIVSAKLELTVSENKDFAETLVAHRLNRAWDEELVTWNTAEEGVSWSSAGGDFEVLGSAAATVAATVAASDKVSFDMTSDVRAFLIGTANQGWLVKVNDQTGQNSDRLSFASRESAREADRPRLFISYCE